MTGEYFLTRMHVLRQVGKALTLLADRMEWLVVGLHGAMPVHVVQIQSSKV